LRSLRTVVVAGEACTRELVARHLARLPGCELHNEYGPTEGTVWCTAHDCATPSTRPSVPIGRPIPGAEAWVVDARGQLAPLGVAGELWLGGAGVAPGYLDRPELTAERFLPDRFGGRPGARLYRTGDLVRWQCDGTLEFLGRVDHQVKIRGQRVELGEIEAVLAERAGVAEALVHAWEPRPGEKELVAYVVPASGADASAQRLRAELAARLPEVMVPAHFVLLDELPRLPNGKVDRSRLPDPLQAGEARAAYQAPRTPLETVLVELWAEVLDRDGIGIDDDFFLLGGHSILATQLFARITDALGVRIALRALFEARTVRALAEELLRDPATRARLERTAELLAEALTSDDNAGA
jgi:acyl-coenzyme A synthetase/AMP-(fatty) acid ligase